MAKKRDRRWIFYGRGRIIMAESRLIWPNLCLCLFSFKMQVYYFKIYCLPMKLSSIPSPTFIEHLQRHLLCDFLMQCDFRDNLLSSELKKLTIKMFYKYVNHIDFTSMSLSFKRSQWILKSIQMLSIHSLNKSYDNPAMYNIIITTNEWEHHILNTFKTFTKLEHLVLPGTGDKMREIVMNW